MTRKAFSSDVQAASEKSIPGITKVGKGEDDGDVTFLFSPASGPPIEIGLLALGKFIFLVSSVLQTPKHFLPISGQDMLPIGYYVKRAHARLGYLSHAIHLLHQLCSYAKFGRCLWLSIGQQFHDIHEVL
jgi:hypothetical protein